MSSEDSLKINKLLSKSVTKSQPKFYVKDAELQIHVPTPKNAQQLDDASSFKGVLSNYVGEVNQLQHDAETQVQKLAAGETDNLHDVTIAMSEAETSFELMMEIRNKLVEAYKEINRMPV